MTAPTDHDARSVGSLKTTLNEADQRRRRLGHGRRHAVQRASEMAPV